MAADIEKRAPGPSARAADLDQADDDEEKRLLEVSQRASLDDRPLTAEEPEDTTNDRRVCSLQGALQSIKDPPKDNKATQRKKGSKKPRKGSSRPKEIRKHARQQAKQRERGPRHGRRKQKLPDALVSQTPAMRIILEVREAVYDASYGSGPASRAGTAHCRENTSEISIITMAARHLSPEHQHVQYDVQSMGTAKFDSGNGRHADRLRRIARNEFQAPHFAPGMAVYLPGRRSCSSGWGAWSQSRRSRLAREQARWADRGLRGSGSTRRTLCLAEDEGRSYSSRGAEARCAAIGCHRDESARLQDGAKKVASECATLMLKASRAPSRSRRRSSQGLLGPWLGASSATPTSRRSVARKLYNASRPLLNSSPEDVPCSPRARALAWPRRRRGRPALDRGLAGQDLQPARHAGQVQSIEHAGPHDAGQVWSSARRGKFSRYAGPRERRCPRPSTPTRRLRARTTTKRSARAEVLGRARHSPTAVCVAALRAQPWGASSRVGLLVRRHGRAFEKKLVRTGLIFLMVHTSGAQPERRRSLFEH